jgi:hypothetical protein
MSFTLIQYFIINHDKTVTLATNNNTGVKFVYQYCKVFQNFCIVMDVYLLICVITTGNV